MSVNTVCMTLVASRNLTTLFASACMLHPEIQVLNHFPSINKDPETNFLTSYSNEKLNNFANKVRQINKEGTKIPGEGGVITKAHAFNSDKAMRDLFFKRFDSEHKECVKSIVWKDSPRNTKILQRQDLGGLFSKTDKLRFILTLRNPMDCATSSSQPGYNSQYRGSTKEEILEELFERYQWFLEAEKKYPKYFMSFFEFDPDDSLLNALQKFLMVDNDTRWKKDFQDVWKMKRKYDHPHMFKMQYKKLIQTINDNEVRNKLTRYLDA